MILDFSIALCWIIAIVKYFKDRIKYHDSDFEVFEFALVATVGLVGLLMFPAAISAKYTRIDELEPVCNYKLEEIDGSYVIHTSSDQYYCKYNGEIHNHTSCFIVDTASTGLHEPIIYVCRHKPNLWIPYILQRNFDFYVLVVENINVINTSEIPTWINVSQ